MTLPALNSKARELIKRVQETPDYTEKRELLSQAVHALKPHAKASMVGSSNYRGLIDRMLTLKNGELEQALRAAAGEVWK